MQKLCKTTFGLPKNLYICQILWLLAYYMPKIYHKTKKINNKLYGRRKNYLFNGWCLKDLY